MSKLLITDLDNTLYNLIDYFGPSFRAMVHALSRKTKIEEEVLLSNFKQVFLKRESLEYGFAVQELEIFHSLPPEKMFALIKLAKGAFKRGRDKYLRPYSTVKETLEWLTKRSVIVVGVSNAPFFNAQIRLKQLHIDKYFYGLAARKDLFIPEDEYTKNINQKKSALKFESTKIVKKWILTKEQMKPNPFAYKKIMDDLKISPEDTYVIGDSIAKDIQPAIEVGAKGIWAKYGEKSDKKNLDTVLNMTNWSSAEIKKVFFDKHKEPEFIANTFNDLKHFLKTDYDQQSQLSLFKHE